MNCAGTPVAEHLDADAEGYLRAASLNVDPPPVVSDPLVEGGTPVEQLLRVLGLAANSGDPGDRAEGAELHGRRDAWTTEAAGTFTEQDTNAAQQLPQLASGIAAALTGTVTGLLQPLVQGAQQAVQAIASLANPSDPGDLVGFDDPVDFDDPGGTAASDAVSGIGPVPPAIAPTAAPAPPTAAPAPPPAASSATHPSSSTAAPPARVVAAPPATAPAAAMTGMPMIPPAALPATGNESKPDTKRVAVGPVRTGLPGSSERSPAIRPKVFRSGSANSGRGVTR